MENNVKETDVEVKSIKYGILSFAYLVVVVALVGAAIKTEHESLLIATSVAMGLLVLLNLRYVIINKKKIKSMHIYKGEATSTELHPLELYMIDCIWNHKKKKFTRNQIEAAILYEITTGNLELTEKGLGIASTAKIDELSVYSLITMEMSLLEKIDCRKIRRLKINKLKNLQEERISIVMEDVNSNISQNCLDTHLFYEQSEEMKEKYFKNIESKSTVYLTFLSWISVILTSLFAFNFADEATVLNFYLPIGIAVVLVATMTSKYRERVTIRENWRSMISDSLNYINYLEHPESSTINEIYAYCLGKSKNSKYSEIFKK